MKYTTLLCLLAALIISLSLTGCSPRPEIQQNRTLNRRFRWNLEKIIPRKKKTPNLPLPSLAEKITKKSLLKKIKRKK